MHNLGALSLDSQPLKYSLRAEAANWKVAFSRTIHKRAAQDLMVGAGWVGREGEEGQQDCARGWEAGCVVQQLLSCCVQLCIPCLSPLLVSPALPSLPACHAPRPLTSTCES